MDTFQWLDWGIAGVLATIIFIAYRNLVNQLRDDRKYIEDRMAGIIDNYHEDCIENTKVQTELITWLKAKNGNK